MCKHRYYPMDILFLEDEKIELINSEIGDVAVAILSKTWAKLAQMDKAGYSYPANWKMLKLAIKSTSSVKTIERVIRGFGLFAFEGEGDSERFYSPRLRDHFTDLDAKAGGGREISDEARAKMGEGGRNGKGGGRPKKQGENKVDNTENKVGNKVENEKNKVDDTNLVLDDTKKQGENKVDPQKDQGNGGNIGGLNAPKKKEREKGERNAPAESSIDKKKGGDGYYDVPANNGILTPILSIYEEVRNEYPILPAPPLYDSNIFYQAKELTDAWGGEGFRDRLGKALRRACASTFLRGKKNLFKYAWLTELANLEKIEAGNYDDDEPKARSSSSASTATHYTNAAWQEVAPPPTTPEQDALLERLNSMTLEDFYEQASAQQ